MRLAPICRQPHNTHSTPEHVLASQSLPCYLPPAPAPRHPSTPLLPTIVVAVEGQADEAGVALVGRQVRGLHYFHRQQPRA